MYPSRSLSNKKKKTPRKKKQETEENLISTPLDKRPLLILGQLDQWLVEIRATQNFSQQCDQCYLYVHMYIIK